MEIISYKDVDFDYIGLASFNVYQDEEMQSFFDKLRPELDKLVIDFESVFQVVIRYNVDVYSIARSK